MKIRIPLEDDAVVTERGVEWLYPKSELVAAEVSAAATAA